VIVWVDSSGGGGGCCNEKEGEQPIEALMGHKHELRHHIIQGTTCGYLYS